MNNENLSNMPQDKKPKDYTGILLEDMNSKMSIVLELVTSIDGKVTGLKSDVEEIKPNVELIPTIRAAVTDLPTQVNDHETRISQLEEAA